MTLKFYFVLGIIFLIAGSVLTVYDTYLYLHLVDLQEQYFDTPSNPGSSKPYPEYDLLFFIVPIIMSFIVGASFIIFDKIKNTNNC